MISRTNCRRLIAPVSAVEPMPDGTAIEGPLSHAARS